MLLRGQETHVWLRERGFKSFLGTGLPQNKHWAAKKDNHHKRMQVWFNRSLVRRLGPTARCYVSLQRHNGLHSVPSCLCVRAQVILQLLKLGYNVVQSDGDALWLQNPLFEFRALLKEKDVIFSRGLPIAIQYP